MKLSDHLNSELVWVLDTPASRDALLGDLCERVCRHVGGLESGPLLGALLSREGKGSTATPEGVAFPHAMLPGLEQSYIAVAALRRPLPYGDGGPGVDLVFMLVGPSERAWEHVRMLARIARVCHTPGALGSLRGSADAVQLFRRLEEEDGRHV